MRRVKKRSVFTVLLLVVVLTMAGCSSGETQGSVYYLNFKPEVAEIWEEIAKVYTEETGVDVTILTAASGTYERTLSSEIGKKDAPTLFQINGPVAYESWQSFCLNLQDTELYSWLLDKAMAVSNDTGVYGIPYVVEGYGIIYNEAIMEKYFALPDKAVTINSTKEINNFELLQAVVSDMTLHKEQLGIEGVFASTSLASGEDWRWQTHLANIPVYYEFKENDIVDTDTLAFTYSNNYKNIFDLYINNSITSRSALGKKTVGDSMQEFALGKVAMVQNGNWAWSQISSIEGNIVSEDDVKFLPIYTGVEGEENQGLCTGTENFLCVNSMSSEADQKATIAFVEWLFSSEVGKDYVTNKLGFISPFNTFTAEETPDDPLAKEVVSYMADGKVSSVSWNFTAFPSQTFKDKFGAALLRYAQGEEDWGSVVSEVKNEWADEKAKAKE